MYSQETLYIDGCEAETFKGYDWPETALGDYASSECPCAEFLDSLAGRVLRSCGGDYVNGAQWSQEIDNGTCATLMSDITKRLCQAVFVSIAIAMLQGN